VEGGRECGREGRKEGGRKENTVFLKELENECHLFWVYPNSLLKKSS
jgi:hypothetical protein